MLFNVAAIIMLIVFISWVIIIPCWTALMVYKAIIRAVAEVHRRRGNSRAP